VHAKHRCGTGTGTAGWQVKSQRFGWRAACCELLVPAGMGDGVQDGADLQGDQVVKLVAPVAKSAPNNATFACGGDPVCTGPGGASKNPACAGPGGAASARVSLSSRRSRAFSVRSSASSLAICAGIGWSASRSCTLIILWRAVANSRTPISGSRASSAASQPTGSGDPPGSPTAGSAPLRRADAILASGRLDHRLAVSLAVRERRQRRGRVPAVQHPPDLHRFGPDKELWLLATCWVASAQESFSKITIWL
jgi:hypothetical protein